MKIQLELAHKKARVKNILLKADTVIGRSSDCGLRIASNEVSRQHCKICVGGDGVTVRDLGSSNGTYVNGYQLEPGTDYEIAPDSELSLGGIKFIVRFSEPAAQVMQSDGLGSTVDLKPSDQDDTADLRPNSLDREPVPEEMNFAEAEESPAEDESPEADSDDEVGTVQVDRSKDLDAETEGTDYEMSTHGDSAVLVRDNPPGSGEETEQVGDADSASHEVTEEVADSERAESEEGEDTAEVEKRSEETGESQPGSGEKADQDDAAAFLNQVSEEEAEDDDESLGDFFKQFE